MGSDRVKELEKKLEDQKLLYEERGKLYTDLLDHSSDPIFSFAPDGTYLYINNAFANPMKRTPSDIIGKKIWDVFSKEEADKRFALVKKVFATKTTENIEVRVDTPTGDVIYFLTTVKPILNEEGNPTSVICISKNITEFKKTKMALEVAKEEAEQANKAKSEFISNMSHELRTPLNAVIGFSELLSNMSENSEELNYINSIRVAGKNLLTLINDILDLSKIEAGMLIVEPEEVNINILLEEISQIFKTKIEDKGVSFDLLVSSDIPKVIKIDETRLRQILFNLVGNADKFTAKGKIGLEVSSEVVDDKLNLKVKVDDTGIGISEEGLTKIFESFVQDSKMDIRRYGGTGLGLSICSKLANAMNGEISVESELGKGSSFTLLLKGIEFSDSENLVVEGRENLLKSIKFEKRDILVVDDIESNREMVKGILNNFGFNICLAENGKDALEILEKRNIDLVFMDIRMPVMDGIEATKIISRNGKISHIPVVALTASSSTHNRDNILEFGFSGFLDKPFTLEDLVDILGGFFKYERIDLDSKGGERKLDLKDSNNYQGLIKLLNEEIIPECEEIIKIFIMDKAYIFVDKLEKIGDDYGSISLQHFCKDLRTFVDDFDNDGFEERVRLLMDLIVEG